MNWIVIIDFFTEILINIKNNTILTLLFLLIGIIIGFELNKWWSGKYESKEKQQKKIINYFNKIKEINNNNSLKTKQIKNALFTPRFRNIYVPIPLSNYATKLDINEVYELLKELETQNIIKQFNTVDSINQDKDIYKYLTSWSLKK